MTLAVVKPHQNMVGSKPLITMLCYTMLDGSVNHGVAFRDSKHNLRGNLPSFAFGIVSNFQILCSQITSSEQAIAFETLRDEEVASLYDGALKLA